MRQPVVSGSDAPELLELADGSLDPVAMFVGVAPDAAKGENLQQTPMIETDEVERRLNGAEDWILLDVCDADERSAAAIEGSLPCSTFPGSGIMTATGTIRSYPPTL